MIMLGYILYHLKQLMKMQILMLVYNIVIGNFLFDNLLVFINNFRGLKLSDKENHSLIVDLLCSLTQGLISKWIMNKAQATAVMAVQYAA